MLCRFNGLMKRKNHLFSVAVTLPAQLNNATTYKPLKLSIKTNRSKIDTSDTSITNISQYTLVSLWSKLTMTRKILISKSNKNGQTEGSDF